jgi:mersacidin/lichenicidin family type 2 lantibiotic
MSTDLVIRAWKDEEFRRGLSASERAALLPNPVGVIDLREAESAGILGGLDLDNPDIIAGTSWKPMCNLSACWKCPPSKKIVLTR